MAVLDGLVLEDAEVGSTNPNLTLGLHDFAYLDWPTRQSIISHDVERTAFAYTDNLPVSADNAHAIDGLVPISYFDDYYNRVHIIPIRLALGNVVSTQIRVVDVWNAYLVPVTLTAITGGAEGLAMEGPDTFPMEFGAIQLTAWELHVTTTGPAQISAAFTWTFTDVETPDLEVTGNRVVAWHFLPNWLDPVREQLSWVTDVLRMDDGSEQRSSLVEGPRQQWDFTFDVSGRLRRMCENALFGWGGQVWALPIFPDGAHLADGLAAASTTITVDTTTRDYHEGGLLLLIAEDGLTFESCEVESVSSGSVDLARETLGSWPAGTWVFPARTARLVDAQGVGRFTTGLASGQARFETVEQIVRSFSAEATYRSYPVMAQQPNWRDLPNLEFRRQLGVFDSLIGTAHVYDRSGLSETAQSVLWSAFDRTEANALRAFLYARAGRHKGVWVPTWTADIELAAILTDVGLVVDVVACGIVDYTDTDPGRQDIRIELKSGAVYYRRISTLVGVDENTERFTLSSALGVEVAPDDVLRISWMAFMRLDDDVAEIEWSAADVAESTITLTGPRNGV